MRNRFKPVLSAARRSRQSTSSTSSNSEGNASSSSPRSSPAVESQLDESTSKVNEGLAHSESLESNTVSKQTDAESTAFKTPAPFSSSIPAVGSLRRSRVKPVITSVPRSRPNAASNGKATSEAKRLSVVNEESHLVSQDPTSNKDDQLSMRLVEQDGQSDVDTVSSTVLSSDNVVKSPSLKERNQQALSTRGSTLASSPTLTNTEQRSQPVAQDVVIKPSQVQNKNTNSDNVLTQPIDGGATPSLLRRKRALPNLGSGARKRRSSVSKENVDKNPDVPEVGQEEEIVSHKDLGHSNEQSSVGRGGSRSKRLRTLSEGENNADHAVPHAAVPDVHGKDDVDDDEEEEDDNKKKGLKRKRGGRPHKLKEPSDPSHMTMQHLIYFNPKTNPMTSSLAGKKKKADGKNKSKKKKEDDTTNSGDKESEEETGSVKDPGSICGSPAKTKPAGSQEPSGNEDGVDGAAVAPRVKLAADGSIILDEESLLIPKSPENTLNDSEIVYEDADAVSFGAYLKHRKVERWSLEETQKFYKALSQVGTDFSLMGPLFPNRKRRELKAKFKREEKQHRSLVEKALVLRNPIDVELFTPKVDGEEIDDDLSTTDNISSTIPTEES